MGLTRLAVRRPLATIMVFLAFILLGQQAYTRLRVDRYPAITFPVVSVSIGWPGASPEDIEQSIIVPAEDAISGVSGVQTIDAVAQEGNARIIVYFFEGTDVNQALIDVQRVLAGIGRLLPTDATQPTVAKFDPQALPIMNIIVSGGLAPGDLYDLAYNVLEKRLQSVPGVANVSLSGGLVREVQVLVDYAKLQAYGLSFDQISNAIQRENVNSPGGKVDVDTQTFSVRAVGLAQSPADMGNYVVANTPNGPIYLRDVATIQIGYKRPTMLQRFTDRQHGQFDAIQLSVTKQTDANTLDTANAVRAAVEQMRRSLPSGVDIQITNDTSRFVRRSVDAVQKDLILAILIVGAVLFLFLHTFRSTIIVLISIPTCLVTTFLLMYTFGFTINTITLMAMALAIGILVDDSIVVLENIARHLSLGENPMEAALNGRSEIGMAAIAITLTDVIVFVPISFMSGNIGKLFREFGLTIASITLLSLLVSFTLVPVLASRWLRAHDEEALRRGFAGAWERGFDRLATVYRRLLHWALHHRPLVVATAAAVLFVSFLPLQYNLIGQEYAPLEDDGQFTINTEMPPGTSLQGNSAALAKLEEGLLQIPEVDYFTTTVGQSGSRFGGTDRNGQITVQLVERSKRQRSVFEVMQDVRRLARNIPGLTVRANVQQTLIGAGGSVPINIRLLGDNIVTLRELAAQVEQIVRSVPGTTDVRNDAAVAEPEIQAIVDRKRLADLNVSAAQVANALRTAIGGNTLATTQLRVQGQNGIDITVLANADLRNDLTSLANIPIAVGSSGSGASGPPSPTTTVRLGQVAELRVVDGQTEIDRSDRQRRVSVQANLVNRSVGDAARDIQAALARVPFPSGYRWVFFGQVDALNQARVALLSAVVISVVLVYMLLVALYESLMHPLAIMFSLPVALVGAFAGLLVTGNTFNLFSMIGIIMLMGLVAKNAILLVDFTNTLRARGRTRLEALLEAGPIRLRPIIMTTCTVVFAMLPLALKFEEGSESRAPLAVVLIGGSLTSTLLTLVLVPVMYTYLDDLGRLPALAWARIPRWRRRAAPVMAGGAGPHSSAHPTTE